MCFTLRLWHGGCHERGWESFSCVRAACGVVACAYCVDCLQLVLELAMSPWIDFVAMLALAAWVGFVGWAVYQLLWGVI